MVVNTIIPTNTDGTIKTGSGKLRGSNCVIKRENTSNKPAKPNNVYNLRLFVCFINKNALPSSVVHFVTGASEDTSATIIITL